MIAGVPTAADLSKVDHFSRQQGLSIRDVFPVRTDGLCACGCGQKLTGRRTRWATAECSDTAVGFYFVISGNSGAIRWRVHERDHGVCAECDRRCGVRLQGPMPFAKRFSVLRIKWEADHIIPVHLGGGGCGLENFQTLCEDCHKKKTARGAARRAASRREQNELFTQEAS